MFRLLSLSSWASCDMASEGGSVASFQASKHLGYVRLSSLQVSGMSHSDAESAADMSLCIL